MSQRKCRFQVDKYLIAVFADDIFTQVYCIKIRLAPPLRDSHSIVIVS